MYGKTCLETIMFFFYVIHLNKAPLGVGQAIALSLLPIIFLKVATSFFSLNIDVKEVSLLAHTPGHRCTSQRAPVTPESRCSCVPPHLYRYSLFRRSGDNHTPQLPVRPGAFRLWRWCNDVEILRHTMPRNSAVAQLRQSRRVLFDSDHDPVLFHKAADVLLNNESNLEKVMLQAGCRATFWGSGFIPDFHFFLIRSMVIFDGWVWIDGWFQI